MICCREFLQWFKQMRHENLLFYLLRCDVAVNSITVTKNTTNVAGNQMKITYPSYYMSESHRYLFLYEFPFFIDTFMSISRLILSLIIKEKYSNQHSKLPTFLERWSSYTILQNDVHINGMETIHKKSK